MARVYQMSRCKNQLAYRILCLIEQDDRCGKARVASTKLKFTDQILHYAENSWDAWAQGALQFEGSIFSESSHWDEDLPHELLQAYETGFREGFKIRDRATISGVILDILSNADTIWCDIDAVNHFVLMAQSGRLATANKVSAIRRMRNGLAAAVTTACYGMQASQHGSLECAPMKMCQERLDQPAYRTQWLMAEAAEKLMLGGLPSRVKRAHESLLQNFDPTDVSDFEVDDAFFQAVFSGVRIWQFLGTTYVLIGKTMWLFEHSTLDALRLAMRFWEKTEAYFRCYRLLGNCGTSQGDVLAGYRQAKSALLKAQLADLARGQWFNWRFYAMVMKKHLAILQNEISANAEVLDVGKDERHRLLVADASGVIEFDWYKTVKALDMSDRAKLDLAYLFHCFPAPDIDPSVMFKKTMDKMSTDTPYNRATVHQFRQYAKMLYLATTTARERVVPSYQAEEGYDLEDTRWFKDCLKGRLSLAPMDEWGKAWLHGHFEAVDTLTSWHESAQDVTHVLADPERYRNVQAVQGIERECWNELTYCLKWGSTLSEKYSPQQVQRSVAEGKRPGKPVAVMAAKAENTKPEDKARETFSHDDVTRELNTMIDHSAHQLTKYMQGPSIRRSPEQLEKTFHNITKMTLPRASGAADPCKYLVVASMDLKGWSPSVERNNMLDHHAIVVEATKLGPGWSLKSFWQDITLTIAKRGVVLSGVQNHGTFQGWTPTIDSLYHYAMLCYIIAMAKSKEILQEKEYAMGLCLIDDAVLAVPLMRPFAEAQAVAKAFYKHAVDTYAALGFEVEIAKTIYSGINYIYLNRHFVGGSEVHTPMKVFAKADREFDRRFTSLLDQVRSVFNSYGSAMAKGADPAVCYYFSHWRSADLWIQTAKKKFSRAAESLCTAAFAPTSLGGIGYPTFGAFCTKETPDSLSSFIWSVQVQANRTQDPMERACWAGHLTKVLDQPLRDPSLRAFMRCANALHGSNVPDPGGDVTAELAKALKRHAKAAEFRDAFIIHSDRPSAALCSLIKQEVQWDPHILAELAECTPAAMVDALVARCVKNESLAFLISQRKRQKLAAKVRSENQRLATYLLGMKMAMPELDYITDSHCLVAAAARSAYYEQYSMRVVNHTLPDPFATLARQPPTDRAYIVAHPAQLLAPIQDAGASVWGSRRNSYLNFFDGHCGERKLFPRRSAGILDVNDSSFRSLNHSRKAVVRAASISQYLNENGLAGLDFWRLFCTMWGAKEPLPMPTVERLVRAEASAKRFGHVVRTHPIAAFPNTQSCIATATTFARRHYDAGRYNTDLQSETTAAWLIALMASAAAGSLIPVLSFNLRPGCTSLYNPDVFVFPQMGQDELAELAAPRDLTTVIRRAMVDWDVAATDEEILGKAAAEAEEEELGWSAQDLIRCIKFASVREGVVQLGSDLPMPPVPRVSTAASQERRPRGDIAEPAHARTIMQKVRHYEEFVEPAAAAVAGVAAFIAIYAGRKLPANFYTCRWKELPELAEAIFKTPAETLLAGVRALGVSLRSCTRDALAACLPQAGDNCIAYLKTAGQTTLNPSSTLYLLGRLLMLHHGRMFRDEEYKTLALMGPQRMMPCYMYAKKRQQRLGRAYRPGDPRRTLHLVQSGIYSSAWDACHTYRSDSDTWSVLAAGIAAGCALVNKSSVPRDPIADLADEAARSEEGAEQLIRSVTDSCRVLLTDEYLPQAATTLWQVFGDLKIAHHERRHRAGALRWTGDPRLRPVVSSEPARDLFGNTEQAEPVLRGAVAITEPAARQNHPTWLLVAAKLRALGHDAHAQDLGTARAAPDELVAALEAVEVTEEDIQETKSSLRAARRNVDIQ